MRDAEDFREYLVARQGALGRAAYLLTGDPDRAAVLVRRALGRAWRRVREVGDVDAYVERALIEMGTARRWSAPPVRYADRTGLLAAVHRLAPPLRAVVTVRFLLERSHGDTAVALGCTVATVEARTGEALAGLSADLGVPIGADDLGDALRDTLDAVRIPAVLFDDVVTAAHRRRLITATGGAAAVGVGIIVLAHLVTGGERRDLAAGTEPSTTASCPPETCLSSPAPGHGEIVPLPGPSESILLPDPGVSGPAPDDPPPTPTRTGPPPTPAAGDFGDYCPPDFDQRIDWPAASESLFGRSTAWNNTGRPVPFSPSLAVVCRYDGDAARLTGGALLDPTDATDLSELLNRSPRHYADTNPCLGHRGTQAFVIFDSPAEARVFNVDLTSCNSWFMPDSIIVEGPFTETVRDLRSS